MVSMRILVTGDRFWFDPPLAASIVRRLVERLRLGHHDRPGRGDGR